MPSDVTTETMANEAKNILDNCQGRAGSAAFVVKSGDAANAEMFAITKTLQSTDGVTDGMLYPSAKWAPTKKSGGGCEIQ